MIELKKLLNEKNGFRQEELALFQQDCCNKIIYDKGKKTITWQLSLPKLLPCAVYQHVTQQLSNLLQVNCALSITAFDTTITQEELQCYLNEIARQLEDKELLPFALPLYEKQQLILQFSNERLEKKAIMRLPEIRVALQNCGIQCTITTAIKTAIKRPKTVINPLDGYQFMKFATISKVQNKVEAAGKIFKIEDTLSQRGGRGSFNDTETITYYLKDDTGVFLCKRFVKKEDAEAAVAEYPEGSYVKVRGDILMNRMNSDLELHLRTIEAAEEPVGRLDEAPVKRIELHAHTKRSEMDGVSEASELINQAYAWGQDAIAITDHMVVQAFPLAQQTVSKLLKKNPDRPFKVLYGVEMNMVDTELPVVINGDEGPLERVYVVFDLETTGLSSRYDHIIEFGGVKLQAGEVIERLQLFVKPPVPLSDFTKQLTNITDADVENGVPIDEALPKILKFLGDFAIVAQNASFDTGFLNALLEARNMPKLKNPIIDTLNLARTLNKERRSYRLGRIASYYKIEYDDEVAHRADYDAEVTGQVFLRMLDVIKERNYQLLNEENKTDQILTVGQLQKLSDADAFKKAPKSHVVLLAKNQQGIKDLYQLVSLSHTTYLAFSGKTSGKKETDEVFAEPRIPRAEIEKFRTNLLVGSACANGEIFDIASTGTKNQLSKAMAFYDYIEVQAPENYRYLVENHSLADEERLHTILKEIIITAEEEHKPVVATGDVHYCQPDEKILRDIYIQAQGIGGSVHPLYIYNAERRAKSIAPDQHLRTTEEMLACFAFLDEETAHRIVIDTPHQIADQIECCKPVKDKLYTPSIDGADEKLKAICYETARKCYGDPLPEIVEKRLDKELTSILKNGYGVIYYTAYLLVKKSTSDGYLVGSRGSVGSSFVATMANITEVNPLPPHYVCSNCYYNEFNVEGAESGYDLPDKACPHCGTIMKGNGQDIPFETFLGFEGDKVPDIDLNFSGDYQEVAHAYTKEVFGADNVYRAGTIGTVAEKTAFGYIRGYVEKMNITKPFSQAERMYLAHGCDGVKRTTGQHPGGIVVIPRDMDVHDFTPIQYPANNPLSAWRTTHLQFEDIHDNILKLDILGHVDPTAMKLLEKVSGLDVRTIPMNDANVISIFNSAKALKIKDKTYNEKTGALGLPEFGTRFVRGILADTKPTKFSQLVRISGLSHGTDVWSNNAKDLVANGYTLNDVIGCRDDIMMQLQKMGLPSKSAFDIMESVRKGRGLKPEWIELMKANNVPDWYIDSCLKIKYMFPKAHAVAYVIMAIRVAWFKVYHPAYYYISYFTLRCDAYEIPVMVKGHNAVMARMKDIQDRLSSKDRDIAKSVTKKEEALINTFEVSNEMFARGYGFSNISLELSHANEFIVDPNNDKMLIPPFVTIDGLGYNVAKSITDARELRPFLSKQDLLQRTQLSKTLLEKLEDMSALDHLQDENQLQLF